MRLLTVGDSFTYGEELEDRSFAWPNVLAKKLKWELTNLAKPGCGNTRMVRNVVEQSANHDIIIIAWSHWARTEIADEHGFYDIWPGCNPLPYKEKTPWRTEIIEYYSKHHDDQYLYRQYLLNVILLQNYLKSKDKLYLMVDAFANNKTKWRTDQTNKDLLDQIDTRYFAGWPFYSMCEWTWGTKLAKHGHFLAPGHEVVADKIYEHLTKLSWLF